MALIAARIEAGDVNTRIACQRYQGFPFFDAPPVVPDQ